MRQARRNLELKVRCTPDELAVRRALLTEAGVPVTADLYQRDVYFKVPQGRQKMRWIVEDVDGQRQTSTELITYTRPDTASSRWSDYTVEPVPLNEASEVEARLLAAHGVLATVAKQRELAIWGTTRVHFDEVEGLGPFIELETVVGVQPDEVAEREHRRIIAALRLDRLPVVAGSYSDLLPGRMASDETAPGTDPEITA